MEDTGVGAKLGGDNQPKTLCEDDVMHESHRSMVSPSALGDVDEGNILTDDNSDHLDVVGQRRCDLEDLLRSHRELIDSLRILCGDLRWRRDTVEWKVESLVLCCTSSTMH
jgi:hypothetical protein